jgi:hypothetical protein
LESFVESQKMFGHPLPRIVVLDMPGRDESFIHKIIPSMKAHQEELDRMAALPLEVQDEEQTALPDVVLLTPTLTPAEQRSRIKISSKS